MEFVVLPPPALTSRPKVAKKILATWREQFESALANVEHGQIVVRIESHQVVRVDVVQQHLYGKKSLDEPQAR